MAANPRTVAVETWIEWDGVSQRLPRGQVMDVTPGGALERAIGRDRLVPFGPAPVQPPAEEPAPQAVGGGGGGATDSGTPEVSQSAPPKSRTVGKQHGDDGKDGEP